MDMEEKWLPVKGYEGLYAVSNKGRVKSIDRKVRRKSDGALVSKRGKYLKGHIIEKGYHQVMLSKNGVRVPKLVHRLVLETFMPVFNEGLEVNHKDLNKRNNALDNLEWVTPQENTRHAWANGACDATLQQRKRKIVDLLSGRVFDSISGASRELGIPHATLYRRCKYSKGYAFYE